MCFAGPKDQQFTALALLPKPTYVRVMAFSEGNSVTDLAAAGKRSVKVGHGERSVSEVWVKLYELLLRENQGQHVGTANPTSRKTRVKEKASSK